MRTTHVSKTTLEKENIVNFQSLLKKAVTAFALATASFSAASYAQTTAKSSMPPFVRGNMNVAERTNLYCAGFVQNAPMDTSRKIVGGVEEQENFHYSQNNVLYVNLGSNKGVQVGDVMSVVRPRGQVKTRWTKKGDLGFYVQEVGAVEIIRVKPDVSVARVKTSCDNILLGDLVQPTEKRVSPVFSQRPAMDLFADASGKATGRLFMARDSVDLIGRDNVVYIDLGAEDNVKVGDYLTVFRPLGKGHLFVSGSDESVTASDDGFSSMKFQGGKFSNQAARKSGEQARGKVVTIDRAKEGRPDNLRKVVGEMVILNVKERTATAVITRNAQEILPGDWVEVQ
jgi:hypothetical protein